MDEYNKSLIKRWHDSRVFNLEKDRFKQKRIISTEITPIDSYSMTSKSLYPYLLADTFNRYFKMCGENIYYIIGIDTASYVSYSFLSNHYLDSKNMLKEYLDVLNIMGVGFDYESIITQENDFVLKEIDKIFLSLYNKDIFFENGPVLTDSLGIKIYNYFETRENNGAFYDAKTDALLCKTSDDYFYFEMRPYIKELETLIDGLSLSAEKKDKIYERLGKKRCVKFLFSNYKEKIEIKVNLPKTYWLGGVVAILLNPKYMDVMPYVCSTEYEVVNHYLQNGYQAGVFSGTTVLNPLTGEEVLLFISYDTECDIYPLIPACRKFDKIYTDSFGLDVKEITENDLMINSDFLNGLDINEASRALEENFVFEGMAFIEYQYESTKLIISKKEGYGILIPMMLKNEREKYEKFFIKSIYWSRNKMEAFALKYSKGYRKKSGYTFWEKDFDAMARKTMLRQLISKWGIMSIEMQKALDSDMAVVNEDGTVDYIDSDYEEDNSSPSNVETPSENDTTVVESNADIENDPLA